MVALEGGLSVRLADNMFGFPRMSLKRRAIDKKIAATNEHKILGSYRPVFNYEQEIELVDRILNIDHRVYGLTIMDVSYQFAKNNKILHTLSNDEEAAKK